MDTETETTRIQIQLTRSGQQYHYARWENGQAVVSDLVINGSRALEIFQANRSDEWRAVGKVDFGPRPCDWELLIYVEAA